MPNILLPNGGFRWQTTPDDLAKQAVIRRMYGYYNVRGPMFYPSGPNLRGLGHMGVTNQELGLELCQGDIGAGAGAQYECSTRNMAKTSAYYCEHGSPEDCAAIGQPPPVTSPTYISGANATSSLIAAGNLFISNQAKLGNPNAIALVPPGGFTNLPKPDWQIEADRIAAIPKPNQSVPPKSELVPISSGIDKTIDKLVDPLPTGPADDGGGPNLLTLAALAGVAILLLRK